ncbi:MAG: alpha-L-fucosidase [Armatimonadota bacterium]
MSKYPHGDVSWFVHDRFGLFIHWGVFSTAGRHEQVMSREKMTVEEYRKYFDHFDPDLFDPGAWACEAKRTGMRYFVVTAKHHDGFCLFDSALTDYKATNTKARRDLLREIIDAFRAEGLRVGIYYSLLDWHHPEFPLDGRHPLRDDLEAREQEKNRDIARYREYMFGQIRELLTNYGRIDILWLDFSYPHSDWGWSRGKGRDDWDSESLMKMVRQLQPHLVLNDRLDLPGAGDFITPEQFQPPEWPTVNGIRVVWEACHTLNVSWGYDRDALHWKSADMLLRMLIDCVSKGGNFLLNVGPNGRGEFEPKAVERLRFIGEWMRLHSRSIYGCTASNYAPPPDCRYTQNGNRLYLHLFSWPYKYVYLQELADKVEYAQLLNDGSEIKHFTLDPTKHVHTSVMSGLPGAEILELPIIKPDVAIPIVELFLKE